MDRKSKVLLYVFFFLFVGTVMFSYFRYVVFRDFEVVQSDPETSANEGGIEIGGEGIEDTSAE